MSKVDVAKQLRKELENLRRTGETRDACFIRWYLGVRLGNQEPFICDGPGDGGIDAIRYPDPGENKVLIVQSYYADVTKSKSIPLSKFERFLELPDIFSNKILFDEWIENVRTDLKPAYRDLYRKLRDKKFHAEWMFLTTAKSNVAVDKSLKRFKRKHSKTLLSDKPEIIRAFLLYLEGAAPPDEPLTFRYEGQPLISQHKEPTVAVYAAKLDDILKYVKKDPTLRLFSRNVRLAIKGSKINEGMKKTFMSSPEEFLHGHNGLTIICSNSSISHGVVTLEQPNVVNGAQTLLSLRDLRPSRGKALILTRIVDVGDYGSNSSIVRNIVVRSNTQNAITPPDLVACDQRQVEIERYFRAQGRIYIRRRGQEVLEMGPRAGKQIKSVNLAKVMACCDSRVGIWAAGHSKNALFENDFYKLIFEKPSLKELFAKYRLYELLDDSRKSASMTKKNKYRYAWRNVLAAAWQIIDGDIDLRKSVVQQQSLVDIRIGERDTTKLRNELRNLYEDGWNMYLKVRKRDADMLPHKYFFGDSERANTIADTLARRHSKKIIRVLKEVFDKAT